MTRTVVIVFIIAAAARTALSAPKTRDSYRSIQDRIQQLAKDFETHLQGLLSCKERESLRKYDGTSAYIVDAAGTSDAFVPRHCADLLQNGQHTSGVYTVFHEAAGTSGQDVYCDMDTDDGGWTVIQRRGQYGHNAYYFYRNWREYANGFGAPADEYWIGNKALHALTSGDEKMVLRIVLSNRTEDTVSIDYGTFAVASEGELFELQLGNFSATTDWDAMGSLSGQKFSTYDRDNDLALTNCAAIFRGGWWYSNCLGGNLNGLNLNGPHDSIGDGIVWGTKNDTLHYSYPKVQMMIRPA